MEKYLISDSPADTERIGRELALELAKKQTNAAIRMYGEMGVGKTAFVRGFCSAFGISGVKSPTYTIVNEYRGARSVFHFDMVRIESEDDLYSTGFWEYLEREGAFVLIEWCENVDDFLGDGGVFVRIGRVSEDENKRTVTIRYGDDVTI